MSCETVSPSSVAASLTGLGVVWPPRPRRRSGRVTQRATSCPASTSARKGATAMSGVPRYASRAIPLTVGQTAAAGR